MNKFLLSLTILFIISCAGDKLNYADIDYEARKLVLTSDMQFKSLNLIRVSVIKKELHKFYEKKIAHNRKQLSESLKISDSLKNHKKNLLNQIGREQKQRDEKPLNKLDYQITISYSDSKEEFDDIIMFNQLDIHKFKKELDSTTALYWKTSKNKVYYEIEYEISGFELVEIADVISKLKILVHEDSSIFSHSYSGSTFVIN